VRDNVKQLGAVADVFPIPADISPRKKRNNASRRGTG
jgi:hypothetical protein